MNKKHFNALSQEDFNTRLHNTTNGEVVTKDIYKNNKTKMFFTNIKCGHTFYAASKHVTNGHKCNVCGYLAIGNKQRKTHEEYCKEVYNIWGEEFQILSPYKSDSTKLLVKHTTCGNTYYKLAGSLLQKYGCKFCKESKGEKQITKFLTDNRIAFEREYRDTRCKRKLPLPFDFAIFKEDKLYCLIEYDGELHFKPGRWIGAENKVLKIQESEKIKNAFVEKEGIALIRIPYWEHENINKILTESLL